MNMTLEVSNGLGVAGEEFREWVVREGVSEELDIMI